MMSESDIFLDPDEDTKEVQLNISEQIGRMRLPHTKPDPVYQLRWSKPPERPGQVTLTVKLQRIWQTDGAKEYFGSEGLRLVEVIDGELNGKPVTTEDVSLHLQTLIGGNYWLDSPVFELQWPVS